MNAAMLTSIELSEPHIIQANIDQLNEGKTSEGIFLPDYSPASVNIFGKRPGPWTLRETGDFQESFFLKTEKFPVLFDAADEKKSAIFDKLQTKGYEPKSIFGLTQENKEFVSKIVRKNFAGLLRQIL